MNDCEKFWFRINKKHLIAASLAMVAFTVFGGGWLIAVVIYMCSVEICGMNYLFVLHFSGNDSDALDLVKTLPVESRMFYSAYIKLLILQSTVFAAVYAIGTAIGRAVNFTFPLLPQLLFANETFLSTIGYYAFLLCFVIWALIAMVSLTSGCSTVKRAMLPIATIYCAVIFEAFHLLLLTLAQISHQPDFINLILAATGSVALCVMLVLFVVSVKRNRSNFVTK